MIEMRWLLLDMPGAAPVLQYRQRREAAVWNEWREWQTVPTVAHAERFAPPAAAAVPQDVPHLKEESMTPELLERLARDAGLTDPDLGPWMTDYGCNEKAIRRFAALVAEECAKVCGSREAFETR